MSRGIQICVKCKSEMQLQQQPLGPMVHQQAATNEALAQPPAAAVHNAAATAGRLGMLFWVHVLLPFMQRQMGVSPMAMCVCFHTKEKGTSTLDNNNEASSEAE